jgi:hypothetical protein
MQIQEYTYRADQPFYPKSVWWLDNFHECGLSSIKLAITFLVANKVVNHPQHFQTHCFLQVTSNLKVYIVT